MDQTTISNAQLIAWIISGVVVGFGAMAVALRVLYQHMQKANDEVRAEQTKLHTALAARVDTLERALNSEKEYARGKLEQLVTDSHKLLLAAGQREDVTQAMLEDNQRLLRRVARLLPQPADGSDDDSDVLAPHESPRRRHLTPAKS